MSRRCKQALSVGQQWRWILRLVCSILLHAYRRARRRRPGSSVWISRRVLMRPRVHGYNYISRRRGVGSGDREYTWVAVWHLVSQSIHSAWRKASDRTLWRRIVDTAKQHSIKEHAAEERRENPSIMCQWRLFANWNRHWRRRQTTEQSVQLKWR